MTGAGAPARSCAVWPLAGSYFAVGHEVGLPDRREPWRVPASVGQLEIIHLPTFQPSLRALRRAHAVVDALRSARFLHGRGRRRIFLGDSPRGIDRRTALATNAGRPAAAAPIGRVFCTAGAADAEVPTGKSVLLDEPPFPRITRCRTAWGWRSSRRRIHARTSGNHQ